MAEIGTDQREAGVPTLQVRGLCVAYGPTEVVTGLDLTVEPSDVLVILGRNGAGKSTIARALGGLVRPRSGSIKLWGQEIAGRSGWDIARRGLAFVPEAGGVFPSLSVIENLQMWFGTGTKASDVRHKTGIVFDMFPALGARRKVSVRSLSGGEQRMLALSRVLVQAPGLLVVDEPSLGLAPTLIDGIYRVLALARDAGTSMVLVEQFVDRALDVATNVAILDRGREIWSGPASQVSKQDVYAAYVGGGRS